MRAGYGNAGFKTHQLGKHFGAAYDRQKARAGFDEFGIVRLDRRGDDEDLRVGEVLCRMADHHFDAETAQALDVGAVGDVAALHLVAEIMHDFGDAAHADAADANEVDDAYVEWRRAHQQPPCARRSGPGDCTSSSG